jgi:hypothetical protein
MNTSREVFEKVECKEECYGIFCTAHPDKLDTCKKYINYLEEQNALMLEALKTEYKIACTPPVNNSAKERLGNIINQEQEG